jgi:aspartate 1-decarboxylase
VLRSMMRAKVHGATVTEANLHYQGSLTLDLAIMEELDVLPNEMVQVVNVNNAARLETYVICGERNSGQVVLNGAAARLAQPGDTVLLIFYAWMSEEEARKHRPKVAVVDEKNRIKEIRESRAADRAGAREC